MLWVINYIIIACLKCFSPVYGYFLLLWCAKNWKLLLKIKFRNLFAHFNFAFHALSIEIMLLCFCCCYAVIRHLIKFFFWFVLTFLLNSAGWYTSLLICLLTWERRHFSLIITTKYFNQNCSVINKRSFSV